MKATIDLVDSGQAPIVVKDLARRPWPVRSLLGPWQLDREERAYRRLAGTPGIPRLIGRPDRQSLAIEYIPGRSLDTMRRGDLDTIFFDQLEDLLLEMHRRGIAHGDLHHRDILQGSDGKPYVVDFATSMSAGPKVDPLLRLLFEQMCQADRHAVAKLRRRLTIGPAPEVPPAPLLYRLGGRLKKAIRPTPRSRGPRDH
jgi:predicted Ser/Thr protein kinase